MGMDADADPFGSWRNSGASNRSDIKAQFLELSGKGNHVLVSRDNNPLDWTLWPKEGPWGKRGEVASEPFYVRKQSFGWL